MGAHQSFWFYEQQHSSQKLATFPKEGPYDAGKRDWTLVGASVLDNLSRHCVCVGDWRGLVGPAGTFFSSPDDLRSQVNNMQARSKKCWSFLRAAYLFKISCFLGQSIKKFLSSAFKSIPDTAKRPSARLKTARRFPGAKKEEECP